MTTTTQTRKHTSANRPTIARNTNQTKNKKKKKRERKTNDNNNNNNINNNEIKSNHPTINCSARTCDSGL